VSVNRIVFTESFALALWICSQDLAMLQEVGNASHNELAIACLFAQKELLGGLFFKHKSSEKCQTLETDFIMKA